MNKLIVAHAQNVIPFNMKKEQVIDSLKNMALS